MSEQRDQLVAEAISVLDVAEGEETVPEEALIAANIAVAKVLLAIEEDLHNMLSEFSQFSRLGFGP